MTDTAATLSIVKLFMNADPVVKGVLLLLLAASVWSWAVIIDKLWRLGAASRAAREHEARAASARSPQELSATEGRDPAGLVISAGLAESAAEPRPQPETAGERRERIERAMRLTLNAELRRLGAAAAVPRDPRLRRAVHRPLRHGLGDHAQLRGNRGGAATPALRSWRPGSPRPCSPPRWVSPQRSRQSSPITRSRSISAVLPGACRD